MEVLIGKPSINEPCSMAMLNNQRVTNNIRCASEHGDTPFKKWSDKLLDGPFFVPKKGTKKGP
jgi:hypothetical protein